MRSRVAAALIGAAAFLFWPAAAPAVTPSPQPGVQEATTPPVSPAPSEPVPSPAAPSPSAEPSASPSPSPSDSPMPTPSASASCIPGDDGPVDACATATPSVAPTSADPEAPRGAAPVAQVVPSSSPGSWPVAKSTPFLMQPTVWFGVALLFVGVAFLVILIGVRSRDESHNLSDLDACDDG